MLFRVGIALSLSAVLIVGAAYVRSESKPAPALVSVERPSLTPAEQVYVDAYWPGASASTTNENLSTTDLISRQLVSDFATVASVEGVSQANIDSLVSKYVDGVSDLIPSSTITAADLQIVPNSKENMQKYLSAITKARAPYVNTLTSYDLSSDSITAEADFILFAERFSPILNKLAEEAKGIPVPVALAEEHTRLVNNYFSSAMAMEAIAQSDSDSALAFSGLISFNSDLVQERDILLQINRVLSIYGV